MTWPHVASVWLVMRASLTHSLSSLVSPSCLTSLFPHSFFPLVSPVVAHAQTQDATTDLGARCSPFFLGVKQVSEESVSIHFCVAPYVTDFPSRHT